MEKLKPCPFCGGIAHMATTKEDGGYKTTVYCMSGADVGCFAESHHWALKKDWADEAAVEAWNRRTEEGAQNG